MPSASKSTPENRRDYRELLFRSTEAMKDYVSGVILYDETIRQKAKDEGTLHGPHARMGETNEDDLWMAILLAATMLTAAATAENLGSLRPRYIGAVTWRSGEGQLRLYRG